MAAGHDTFVLIGWQTDVKISEPERYSNPLPDELLEGDPATPFQNLGKDPHGRSRVVLVAAARFPGQAPLTEAFVASTKIQPVQRPERCIRESGRVGQQLLNSDNFLSVLSKGRNDVSDPFGQCQLLLFEQDPDR